MTKLNYSKYLQKEFIWSFFLSLYFLFHVVNSIELLIFNKQNRCLYFVLFFCLFFLFQGDFFNRNRLLVQEILLHFNYNKETEFTFPFYKWKKDYIDVINMHFCNITTKNLYAIKDFAVSTPAAIKKIMFFILIVILLIRICLMISTTPILTFLISSL